MELQQNGRPFRFKLPQHRAKQHRQSNTGQSQGATQDHMLRAFWGSDPEPEMGEKEKEDKEDPLEELIAFELNQRKIVKEEEGKIEEILSNESLKMKIDDGAAKWNAQK